MDPVSFISGSIATLTILGIGYFLLKTRSDSDGEIQPRSESLSHDAVAEEDGDEAEKLPREMAILALLEANDGEEIEGLTRMQKLIFIMQEEWDNYSDDPYPFEKYEFEPHDY